MTRGSKLSRACRNCRTLKSRCDQKLPGCGQCVYRRQKCEGYRDDWELVFRDQTDSTVKRAREKGAKGAAVALTWTENTCLPQSSVSSHFSNEPNVNHSLQIIKYHGESQSWAQPQTHNLAHMITPGPMKRDQFSSFYLKSYFPHTTGPGWDFDMTYSVFSTLFALPQKSQMLDIAFSALSCVFLGKNHSDQQILQYGLRLYNHAIQSMSKAISRKDYSLDIVYTCIVFQQIQSHYCPHGLDEWLVHLDGLGAIMRYYCPGSSLSGPMLSFIYGHHLKLKTVFNEFMHLSEETITWLKEPSEEPLYELTGILAESSRIYTAAYNTDISDYIAFQSLLNDCLSLEESHLDFFLRINDKLDGELPVYTRGELMSDVPSTDDLFGPAYRFPFLNDALLHLYFWISMSFVYPVMRHCQILANADVAVPSRLSDMPRCFRPEDDSINGDPHALSTFYIGKSARCLPFFGQKGMNPWAVRYAIPLATHASRVYTHAKDWERFLWARDVLTCMEHLGDDYAARFREIWSDYWFDVNKTDPVRVLDFSQLAKGLQTQGLIGQGYRI